MEFPVTQHAAAATHESEREVFVKIHRLLREPTYYFYERPVNAIGCEGD